MLEPLTKSNKLTFFDQTNIYGRYLTDMVMLQWKLPNKHLLHQFTERELATTNSDEWSLTWFEIYFA